MNTINIIPLQGRDPSILQQFEHSLVLAGILSQPDNLEHPSIDVYINPVDSIRHLTLFIGVHDILSILIGKVTNPGT